MNIQEYEKYSAEYDEFHKEFGKKMNERNIREEGYAKKVLASRAKAVEPITQERVVSGLKFIAEHRSLNHDELVDGLLELGCNFSIEDINQQCGELVEITEGIKQGDIFSGARIIVAMRNREYSRSLWDDILLEKDNGPSIYHFIRTVTGDETYTKEYVDSLSDVNKMHKQKLLS